MPERRASPDLPLPAREEGATSEAFYRALVEHVPLVTYVVDLTGDRRSLYVSPQIEMLLGHTAAEWEAGYPELYRSSIHPDDREQVKAEVERWYANPDTPWRLDYRMLAADGRVVWVREEEVVVRDERGKPAYAHGYLLDISEEKRKEEALEA